MADADAAAADEPSRPIGSGRHAAQGKKVYKDQKLPKQKGEKVKSEKDVKSEAQAWEETRAEEGPLGSTRRYVWGAGAVTETGGW
jgi:hypothetical protein